MFKNIIKAIKKFFRGEEIVLHCNITATARKNGKIIWVDERHNVVCTAGLERLAGVLAQDYITDQSINYCALGTGTGTAATGDTQLGTESYRNLLASGYHDGAIVYITAYYTETETSGTFKEFGVFIGGTGTANSGYLFNHISGLNWVKDTATTLSVDIKFTLASA